MRTLFVVVVVASSMSPVNQTILTLVFFFVLKKKKKALRGTQMTIYGDGKQTRSFQYISDLISGLVALMDGDHTGPINIGNPGEFTMLELAEVISEIVAPRLPPSKPKPQISFQENTADDPKQRKPDITKARTLLNWEPKVSLKEGLSKMADWLDAKLNAV